MRGELARWGRLAAAVAVIAAAGCSGSQPTARATAKRPPTAAMIDATPGQVVAAAERAFIELNLRPTTTEATSQGACALAETADGQTVTVTATTLANGNVLVHVYHAYADAEPLDFPLLASITAHLGAGSRADAG